MKQFFLDKVAAEIIERFAGEIHEICIVVPNKRASLFFLNYLQKYIGKPIMLPDIIGADTFIESLSDLKVIDQMELMILLFKEYQLVAEEPEPFEDFLQWGARILQDFSEIDRYMVPVDAFFKHINEVRAVEEWNLGDPLTETQKKYLRFWEHLAGLYACYRERLQKAGKGYQGMIFRQEAEKMLVNPERYLQENVNYSHVVFVGFNALTEAEKTFFEILEKNKKATIYWDIDKLYLDDDSQEAGLFLRRFIQQKKFSVTSFISDSLRTQEKRITVTGVPQNVGQTTLIPRLLEEVNSNYDSDTVIVLADEQLLIPVLQSLPKEADKVNVTMGYPLKLSNVGDFFEVYFKVLMDGAHYGSDTKYVFHFKSIQKFLSSSFLYKIVAKETCQEIMERIKKHKIVFFDTKVQEEFLGPIIHFLPNKFDFHDVVDKSQHLLSQAKKDKQSDKLQEEYLFQYAKMFFELKKNTLYEEVIDSSKSLYLVYRQLLNSQKIDLFGEPLKGVQVMGVLETRNLDFKRVIVLSLNEGFLPSGQQNNSFIPFDLKKHYRLPTHQEKDAVYAYHFYRLLQRAEDIQLVYNTEIGPIGGGEQSRFITQIEMEYARRENVTFQKRVLTYPVDLGKLVEKKVEKTPLVLDKIHQVLQKGISPSALITYINCPLDFYYKYILGIKEEDVVEEHMDHSEFGSFVHEILEILYEPYINQDITSEIIHIIKSKITLAAEQVFDKGFMSKRFKYGKNRLLFNVAISSIERFLDNEEKEIRQKGPFFIKYLEEELEATIEISPSLSVRLKGIADRVDRRRNAYRIIDYKTGKVTEKELQLKSWDMLFEPSKMNKLFQLYLYAYMFHKSTSLAPVYSGIYSFKQSKQGVIYASFKEGREMTETINDFEMGLKQVLKEIIDVNIPFAHNHVAKYCRNCVF